MAAAHALGCQACGQAVTPCLVCTNPIPASGDQNPCNKTCSKCGVLNPLGDQHRHLLGIPPTLALPSAMVRRAQVARVGRRPYTLAKHAHYMHLRSNLKNSEEEEEEEQSKDSESPGSFEPASPEGLLPRGGSPVPEIYASAEEGHPLTFLPYLQDMIQADALMVEPHGSWTNYTPFLSLKPWQESHLQKVAQDAGLLGQGARVGRTALETERYYPFSDSESPVKRMRPMISPRRRQREEPEHDIGRREPPTHRQGRGAGNRRRSVAAASNEPTERPYKFFRHDFDELARLGEGTRPGADPGPSVQKALEVTTPLNTNSFSPGPRLTEGVANVNAGVDAHVEGARCHVEGDETTTQNGLSNERAHKFFEHDFSEANQLDTGSTEPYLQTERDSPTEASKSTEGAPPIAQELPSCGDDAQQHRQGGDAPTSVAAAVSTGSVERPHRYFEQDFYAPANGGESVEQAGSDPAPEAEAPEGEEEHHLSKDMTGSEEVPTHREERPCAECGHPGGQSTVRAPPKVDEAGLMRCCSQILELHCPHALRADLYGPSVYPLCGPAARYPPAEGAAPFGGGCRPFVTPFTIDMLRTAHSALTSSTQESTSGDVHSPLRGVERALSATERFLEGRDAVADAQALVRKADAAHAQALRDAKAFAERGTFPLARGLVPRLLEARKQERADRAKKAAEEPSALLVEINALLTTCFRFAARALEASPLVGSNAGSPPPSANLDFVSRKIDNKVALEAVRTAVPLWLRLYHDVAHAAGLLN